MGWNWFRQKRDPTTGRFGRIEPETQQDTRIQIRLDDKTYQELRGIRIYNPVPSISDLIRSAIRLFYQLVMCCRADTGKTLTDYEELLDYYTAPLDYDQDDVIDAEGSGEAGADQDGGGEYDYTWADIVRIQREAETAAKFSRR